MRKGFVEEIQRETMIHAPHRYIVTDARAAAALRRDGFGWGHDAAGLMLATPARAGIKARLWGALKRRMKMSRLEHVNITVSDPKRTAAMLADLFGWRIRWEGGAMAGAGHTVHVGDDHSYVAVYSGNDPAQTLLKADASYATRGAMNHIGVVVDDLDAVARKLAAMGLQAHSHADYEPGRRFYFHDHDGVEFEVISYA